jgi:hypothetical protein
LPPEQAQELAGRLLQDRDALTAALERAHRAGKPSGATALLELLDGLAARLDARDPAVAQKLRDLGRALRCADRVAGALVQGDFGALLAELGALREPGERAALLNALQRAEDQIRAMVDLVALCGSAAERLAAQRFLHALQVGRDAAAQGRSPEQILKDVLTEGLGKPLQEAVASLDRLTSTLADAAHELSQKLNVWALLDFNAMGDDQARDAIKQLAAKGILHALPADKKAELARAILQTPWSDGVLDDDEQALLVLLSETKKYDPVEFYQLIATIGWAELDDHFDGHEHDELLRLCAPDSAPL